MADELRELRAALAKHGVLPQHDAELVSATSVIAGENIRGTWWSHAKGHLIFDVLSAIEDEVASVKILDGKVTLVHRRLFPALAAIGLASERTELHRDAASMLARVEAGGHLRTDEAELPGGSRKAGVIASELERALLVYSTQEHTESGRHARVLVTWKSFLHENGIDPDELPPAGEAKALFDAAAESLGARERLPWNKKTTGKRRPSKRPGARAKKRE
jgi:hypothetical protein